MKEAKIVKLAETEVVSFGPLAHYQPIIGDDEGTTPVRTGIQTSQPGYVAPVHSHPYLEILHILDGTAEAWLEGREDEKVVLGKGDTIALPPGAPHSFRVVGDVPLRLLGTHVSPTRIVNYQDGGPTDGRGYRSSKGASTAPSEPPPETGCAGEAVARTADTRTRS
jgi:mannose-6-phosphate isomerase-like protein (cupin superfamily)